MVMRMSGNSNGIKPIDIYGENYSNVGAIEFAAAFDPVDRWSTRRRMNSDGITYKYIAPANLDLPRAIVQLRYSTK